MRSACDAVCNWIDQHRFLWLSAQGKTQGTTLPPPIEIEGWIKKRESHAGALRGAADQDVMNALDILAEKVLHFSAYTTEKRNKKPADAVIKLCATPPILH